MGRNCENYGASVPFFYACSSFIPRGQSSLSSAASDELISKPLGFFEKASKTKGTERQEHDDSG